MIVVYFLLGMGSLFVIGALKRWADGKGGKLGWYHWAGVAIIALWTLFVVAWIGTSLGEGYAKAAGIGGLVFGLIDVLLFILLRLWVVKAVTAKPAAKEAAKA